MASSSALSLPGSPQWAGTHCRWTCLPPEAEVSRRQIAAPSADFWAPAPVASVASAACESVQRISRVSSRSSPSCCTSSSAARIATSSARVLLHTEPAGVRIFFSSPDGRVIRAPPPPAETPPPAEPSLHIQMARSGRVARCRSAAARLTSSWAVRRTSASTSIRIVTRGLSVHGGRVMWSLSSARVSGTPARWWWRWWARRRCRGQWWTCLVYRGSMVGLSRMPGVNNGRVGMPGVNGGRVGDAGGQWWVRLGSRGSIMGAWGCQRSMVGASGMPEVNSGYVSRAGRSAEFYDS